MGRKRKSKVTFDEELPTKIRTVVKNGTSTISPIEKTQQTHEPKPNDFKKKRKPKNEQTTHQNQENSSEIRNDSKKPHKGKKRKQPRNITSNSEPDCEPHHNNDEDEEEDIIESSLTPDQLEHKISTEGGEHKESKRSIKRKKYAKLVEEKRLKTNLEMQQKCLSYLSLWKHKRNEWKFNKKLQYWLQQHMFDEAHVPNEFWQSLVGYFDSCKGNARNVVIKESVKIIETAEKKEGKEEEESEKSEVKLRRARDIVQNLQE